MKFSVHGTSSCTYLEEIKLSLEAHPEDILYGQKLNYAIFVIKTIDI